MSEYIPVDYSKIITIEPGKRFGKGIISNFTQRQENPVIPAKAGIQRPPAPANKLKPGNMDTRFRGNDGL